MVDEAIKGAFELNERDLSKLDRLAERAKKTIRKIKKGVDDRSVDPGKKPEIIGQGPTPFAKFFDRIEKEQDKGKNKGRFKKLIQSDLGTSKAQNVLNIANNPVGTIQNILTTQLPILGGLLAASKIVKFITAELIKKGGLLDRTFRKAAKTLRDALRDSGIQQEILSGFTQLIMTSQSGERTPRNTYNSFDLFNTNQEALEDDFKVRNVRGLD